MADTQTLERAPSAHPVAYDLNHGDEHHIELCGSASHLANCGIDAISFLAEAGVGVRKTVTGTDGHEWEVWRHDELFVDARRPRTDAERIRWIDHMNARVSSGYFSKDRQSMICEIAFELFDMAAAVATEKPMARSARRALKRKLAVIARVQMSLTYREVDMQDLRAQLRTVGLVVEQVNYWK